MDRLKKPKDFLEKLRLTDSDYKDSGMINHIADLLERYNAEQLILHGVVVPKGTLCLSCKQEPVTHGIGQTKTLCGECWNDIVS